MQIDKRRAALQYQNKVNNAQGHFFEGAIKPACALYSERERADVDKTPEPFRVMEKSRDGIFKGRFTARAQPDFQGTLAGGLVLLILRPHFQPFIQDGETALCAHDFTAQIIIILVHVGNFFV